jgi:hypothetical protein
MDQLEPLVVPHLQFPHQRLLQQPWTNDKLEQLQLSSEASFSICPELWFSDGNITLVAGGIGFRVHRGQLERHSEVFRDMFSFPSAADVDGDPVTMHDAPSDVYFFLKALYDGMCVLSLCPCP